MALAGSGRGSWSGGRCDISLGRCRATNTTARDDGQTCPNSAKEFFVLILHVDHPTANHHVSCDNAIITIGEICYSAVVRDPDMKGPEGFWDNAVWRNATLPSIERKAVEMPKLAKSSRNLEKDGGSLEIDNRAGLTAANRQCPFRDPTRLATAALRQERLQARKPGRWDCHPRGGRSECHRHPQTGLRHE
jgi:hypothetical protein